MKNGILGVTSLSIEHTAGELSKIRAEFVAERNYNPDELVHAQWNDMFPGKVIIKCKHCGQWGAKKCACKFCGAPMPD